MSIVELRERVATPAPEVRAKRRRRLPDLRRWLGPVALIALWQVASATGLLSPDKLSLPWTVLRAGIDTARSGELGDAFAVSITRVDIGFVCGTGVALVLGVVAGLSNWGNVLIDPPVQMRSCPRPCRRRSSVCGSSQGIVASDAILVPRDSPLKSVKELKGKTIGVSKGSSAHGQVLYNLGRAGMSTQDVKLSFLQPADAYGAFRQHQLDAWAVWDPYTSQAKLEAGARVLTDGRGTANGYTFIVGGTQSLSDAGTNSAIRDYVLRHARAERWADTHREEWAQAWAKETGLSLAVSRSVVEAGPDLPVPLDDTVVSSEQELADAFTEDGVLT